MMKNPPGYLSKKLDGDLTIKRDGYQLDLQKNKGMHRTALFTLAITRENKAKSVVRNI
jgi:hypothetical protein